jgi:cobalt-zinc-cadmium efflux system outer membrane protein
MFAAERVMREACLKCLAAIPLALIVCLGGCAHKVYYPGLLPLFMSDQALSARPVDEPAAPQTDELLPPPRVVPKPGEAEPEVLPPPKELPGVTLDQAIRATLEADPKIRAGFETINQAQGDLLTSSLPPNPQLLVDGTTLPFQKPTPERTAGPPETDAFLSWPIDWFLFGKRAAAMASGRLGVDVSAADFADLVRQRVAATIAAFFDVLEAEAMVALARLDLESLKRVETMTKARVRLGGVGDIEVERIRLAVLDTQREVRSREKTLAVAKASLRALMGAMGPDPEFRVAGSLDVVELAVPLAAEGALALAEEWRPDLISLRRQVAKAEADLNVERHKACPTVTPAAGLSRQYQKAAIGSVDGSSFDLSLTLSVPIFDRNQGNIRKAQATQAQVAYNLEAQLVALRGEIEQAAEEFRVAARNITSDAEQLKTARTVRDGIEKAYEFGKLTVLDVLDAERAYRDTYRTYILGRSTYWHSLHKLNAAIGKQVLR